MFENKRNRVSETRLPGEHNYQGCVPTTNPITQLTITDTWHPQSWQRIILQDSEPKQFIKYQIILLYLLKELLKSNRSIYSSNYV